MVPSHRAVWIPGGLSHQIRMHGSVKMRTIYFHPDMRVFTSDQCLAVNVSGLMRELIIHVCDIGIVRPKTVESRSLIDFVVSRARKMKTEPLMLPMPQDERGRQAAHSILANPSLAPAEVAAMHSTSVRTLQRIFSADTGLTLGRWRTQARLLSALPLLEQGRPVTDVSLDLGFESLSAFISSFRKFLGVTPAKYFQTRKSV